MSPMLSRNSSSVMTENSSHSKAEQSLPLVAPGIVIRPLASSRQPHDFFKWSAAQVREGLLCLLLSVTGWYVPKTFFFPTQEQIDSRPIPFQTLSSGEVLLDWRYNQPLVDPPTIGSTFLVTTGVWVPFILIILVHLLWRRNPHAMLCTLLLAIGLSEGITNTLKFWVRRKRPNFYALCAFDGRHCAAPFHRVVEAQLSFPSGHTSLSFCSATVLVLWASSSARHKWKRLVCFLLPWGWATFVALSRIVDYWHHPSDILAGCLLGTTCATLVYSMFHSNDSTEASMVKIASFHE